VCALPRLALLADPTRSFPHRLLLFLPSEVHFSSRRD
jgi:hypothetical protein